MTAGEGRSGTGRVLVVGIYLADRENTAEGIAVELQRSQRWSVDQRWVALGRAEAPPTVAALTVERLERMTPKFQIVNRLLSPIPLGDYEYVLLTDDDIELPAGFLDRYLELTTRHGLSLAQPARTHDSYIDHSLVEQLDGLDARWTRFVEIGPFLSIHRTAVSSLVPFDEASPMGWGYDFAWPVVMERAGLKLGIVDATPIGHRLRKPVENYDHATADAAQRAYLWNRPHLSRADAFTIVEAYA